MVFSSWWCLSYTFEYEWCNDGLL